MKERTSAVKKAKPTVKKGTLVKKGKLVLKEGKAEKNPLIVEKIIKAPIHKVWRTITNQEDMKHWFYSIWEFKPIVGFDFTFCLPDDDKSLVTGVVTRIEEGSLIAYSWNYDDFQVETSVTIEIFPEGDAGGTKLKLTHEGLEKISGRKNFSKKEHKEGWGRITGALKKHVEKK